MLIDKLDLVNKKDIYGEINEWKKHSSNPLLYIWGAGSVAVGVTSDLQKNNISICGYFVNIENAVIDPRIDSDKVVLLDDLVKKDQKFSVVVGHSNYEFVRDLHNDLIENIWILAGVVRNDIVIDNVFVENNVNELEYCYNRLSDDISKCNMIDYLNAKVTHDISHIMKHFVKQSNFFSNNILHLHDSESYLDLGSYDGKSICEFIKETKGKYEKIIAVEVMPKMYQKLREQEWANNSGVEIYNVGISDHEGVDYFNFDSQGTCLTGKSGTPVKVTTIDKLLGDKKVTLIKICIGNTIIPLLYGAKDTIKKNMPVLVISAGIDKYALVKYIPIIEELTEDNGYCFYLRFMNASADCLTLYAIPTKFRE